MKKMKILTFVAGGLLVAGIAAVVIAADHIDSPSVAMTKSDIADFYAFEGDDANSTTFIVTMQGPLTPGTGTTDAAFDENVLTEINIDNTGDFVEDLVIQCIPRAGKMYFFGPAAPGQIGLSSTVQTSATQNSVDISTGSTPTVVTNNGMKFFAGPRRDYFFFDFERFNMVAGTDQEPSIAPDGFLPSEQATDFFENLNVLAIAVEVPNAMLGTAPPHVATTVLMAEGFPAAYNVWVSTKAKQ